MSSPMTQEQRYIKMTETPISRLIPSLAIPTIISMLVTSIYNMADTFFVSQISTRQTCTLMLVSHREADGALFLF